MCKGSEVRECDSFKEKPVQRRNPRVWSTVGRIPHEEAGATVCVYIEGRGEPLNPLVMTSDLSFKKGTQIAIRRVDPGGVGDI